MDSSRATPRRTRADQRGDLHNDAMCTLERYRDERLELSRRAEDIDRAAWTDPAARLVAAEDIRRLRQQLGVLAGQAAIEIDRCAGTLNSFGRYETLPDLAASAPTAQSAAGPASFASPEPVASVSSQPAEPPGAINLDYTLDYGGASDIRRDVYVLGVEILLGRHEVLMGDLTAR